MCLLLAANEANLHFASPHAPVASQIKTSSATVRLNMYPKTPNSITWAQWGAAVRGITDFVNKYAFVDLDFYILDDESAGRMIGGGLVSNR